MAVQSQGAKDDISIQVLGPQIILREGVEIPPPAPQQRRVLAVLASRPGEVVAREAISQRIWGSATAQQLRSLQSYVSHLRTVLGTGSIELVGTGYRLNVNPECIDETRFRRHVTAGLALVGDGRLREGREHLEAALESYRGEPYDDLANGDFAVRRTGLRQLRDAAEDALLRMRVELIRGPQDCDGLVPLLAQAHADHPDRELRAILYARTLAMAGRLSEAGEVYRSFRAQLKEQTGADPSADFTDTMTRLGQRDRGAFSLAWDSCVDIPLYAAPLIDRDREVHAAVTMLEVGGSSLLTIAGQSGVGKTRVAAAVARTMVDDLPGGVVWIDAATITTSEELLQRTAASMGLEEPVRQTLPRALRERRTLVVVDGLAQVDVTSAIAVMLAAGPGVAILVTSTQRIGLASEQVLALQPFSTSGSGATPSPAVAFVRSKLALLAPHAVVEPAVLDAVVKHTSGLPSELEQVALDTLTRAIA